MLNVRTSVIVLFVVVAGLGLGLNAASAQMKMKFAAEDKDLYPTYLGSGTDTLAEKPGVTVELIRLVAKDIGIEPVFVRAPWRRCMELLKEGEVDAVINGSYSSARTEFGAFPMQGEKPDDARKSHVWTYTLYRKKGTQVAWDGSKFSNVDGPLGTPLGYSIVADLKKMNLEVDESGDGESNLRKLSAGRIAGAVLLREATDPLLKSFADVELQSPVTAKSYFIMLSHQLVKKDPAFAEKFWTRFAEIRASKLCRSERKVLTGSWLEWSRRISVRVVPADME